MVKKAPRRTAERILETALALFNRFGEPQVSTTRLAAELRISTGNLYYHFAGKEVLVNALCERYALALPAVLEMAGSVREVGQAWHFVHALLTRIWEFRFLYRDLNDLLARNHRLELQMPQLLRQKTDALHTLLCCLEQAQALLPLAPPVRCATAVDMAIVLSYWPSFEYLHDPRHALEPENAPAAIARGTQHALYLLAAQLCAPQRQALLALIQRSDSLPSPGAAWPAHGLPAKFPSQPGDAPWRNGPLSPTATSTVSTPRV